MTGRKFLKVVAEHGWEYESERQTDTIPPIKSGFVGVDRSTRSETLCMWAEQIQEGFIMEYEKMLDGKLFFINNPAYAV